MALEIPYSRIIIGRGGNSVTEYPLKTLEKLDSKLLRLVEETGQLAFGYGAPPYS